MSGRGWVQFWRNLCLKMCCFLRSTGINFSTWWGVPWLLSRVTRGKKTYRKASSVHEWKGTWKSIECDLIWYVSEKAEKLGRIFTMYLSLWSMGLYLLHSMWKHALSCSLSKRKMWLTLTSHWGTVIRLNCERSVKKIVLNEHVPCLNQFVIVCWICITFFTFCYNEQLVFFGGGI